MRNVFLITKRVFRRLRYFLSMKNLFWDYESCWNCGRSFRIMWSVRDDIWKKVVGVNDDGGGSLCVDCFVEMANNKDILIRNDDFQLEIFNPA